MYLRSCVLCINSSSHDESNTPWLNLHHVLDLQSGCSVLACTTSFMLNHNLLSLPCSWAATMHACKIPRDKMSCLVRFGNCFLRVALMYQPRCLLPCCQGKPGEFAKKTVIQTSETVHFVSWYCIIRCARTYKLDQ